MEYASRLRRSDSLRSGGPSLGRHRAAPQQPASGPPGLEADWNIAPVLREIAEHSGACFRRLIG